MSLAERLSNKWIFGQEAKLRGQMWNFFNFLHLQRGWQHILLTFCTFQNRIFDQLFNVTITGLCKTSFFFFYVNNKGEKLKLSSCLFSAGFVSFQRKYLEDKYRCRQGLLHDICPVICTTWRKVANKIVRKNGWVIDMYYLVLKACGYKYAFHREAYENVMPNKQTIVCWQTSQIWIVLRVCDHKESGKLGEHIFFQHRQYK